LLGVPIDWNEHCYPPGQEGDVLLLDLGGPCGFTFAQHTGGGLAVSEHLWYDYNEWAFRWTERVDAFPLLSAPITRAHGTTGLTASNVVSLAKRAS